MNLIFNSRFVYSAIFTICVAIFLVHFAISGQAVYGDGIGYYAHLRSWVIDGDWEYTNEYKHIYNHENNNALHSISTDQVQIVATTKDGKAENHYSPGVALLLLPFYVLAHGLSALLTFFGIPISLAGYSDIYQVTTGLGAICYVVAGLWLLEQILKKTVGDLEISRLTTLAIFFATQLFYYGSFDVVNSHFASFFLITLFFYVYLLKRKSLENIFLLGLVAGLLTVNRLQDGVIVAVWLFFEAKKSSSEKIKIFFVWSTVFLTGFILSLWPLMYHWQSTFGSIFEQTYVRNFMRDAGGGIDILGSFFNPVTGLFTKAPLLLLVLVYFIYLVKKKRTEYLLVPFVFFLIQILIITIQGGWFAAAYGGRMYISSLIFFALVLGQLLRDLKNRNKAWPYWLVGVFTIINGLSFAYFIFIQK